MPDNIIKKRLLEPGKKLGSIQGPKSIDIEARTVELVWSTGASVLRNDSFGQFNETLSMDPKHVDLSRLQAGAPLLASHDTNSLSSILGVVERVWLESGIGKAVVRFATDPESENIFTKVRDGIIKNVSVGYQIKKMVDVSKKGDKIPTYEAVDWMPYELSLVSVPADSNAQIRNHEKKLTEVDIQLQNNSSEENQKMSVQKERERQNSIRMSVRAAKLDESFADELCSQDITSEQARSLILEKMIEQQPSPINSSVRVDIGSDNETMRARMLEYALCTRADESNFKPTEASRSLFGKSLISQVESTILERRLGESDAMFAKRAMSTSDLPKILANSAEKVMQKSFELSLSEYKKFTNARTVRNFKELSVLKGGDWPNLLERKESSEYQYGYTGEANESVSIKEFGRIVAFSSRMLQNDDLGALTLFSQNGGLSAARLMERQAFSALTTNKVMTDGHALYSAEHGNLGTASAIDSTAFKAAFKAMRSQMSTDGVDYLGLKPAIMVVGLDKENQAETFLASVNPTQTSQVNIYQNSVQLVVSPLVTGNAWYLIADPRAIESINMYTLEGQPSPSISSRVRWETDDLEIKINFSVVGAPVEHKGLYYNPGA